MMNKKSYRFTVLTEQLIRMEYNENGVFEDRMTQMVVNRNFPKVQYQLLEQDDGLEIITEKLHLKYNKKEFSPNGLVIRLRSNVNKMGSTWHYGEECGDLLGTARTLDQADGAIPLEHGILSKDGYACTDDSHSLILTEDGQVLPRSEKGQDLYFWGYGREYLTCLRDFYRLCGAQPLLPRYALGNWWSRYYKYTQAEYLHLMDRFSREDVPFTVGVLDMDWHIVKVDPKDGSGWTGYTWNRELIPEPEFLLEKLHERGLRVTLNVHPADGVMPYEDAYGAMCQELHITGPNTGISFDITNQEFVKAYFKCLHHPNEKIGVDFWWIDWQQGALTAVEGLDPLWMLNYYHYQDNGRDGKRPLILSRYAGIGSHRYPIGFSGDTIVTWESLRFQPYFTANASNVGYGWWSHDIGGHMNGTKDDELVVRWVQQGVFSPINRLHSSDNPFDSKEPWCYNEVAERIIKEQLRLRHRLIPYLYTMNRICARDGLPLIQPMYYQNPMEEQAYEVPNEYWYGTELIAAPITEPMNSQLHMAEVKVWLPKGTWIDIFNHRIYEGNRYIVMYRNLDTMPVLAKAGAILPLYSEKTGNDISNPRALELMIYAGADGSFHLYEDDDRAMAWEDEKWADTQISLDWAQGSIQIAPVAGNREVVPPKRDYHIHLIGFDAWAEEEQQTMTKISCLECEGKRTRESVQVKRGDNGEMVVILEQVESAQGVTICFEKKPELRINSVTDTIFDFLNRAQISLKLKKKIYDCVNSPRRTAEILSELHAYELHRELYGVLCEILTAKE